MTAPVIITIFLVCLLFALCGVAQPMQHNALRQIELPVPRNRDEK